MGHNVRPGAQALPFSTLGLLIHGPSSVFPGTHGGVDTSPTLAYSLDLSHLLCLDSRIYAQIRSPVAIVGYDSLSGFHWAGSNSGIKILPIFDSWLYGLASCSWPVSISLLPLHKGCSYHYLWAARLLRLCYFFGIFVSEWHGLALDITCARRCFHVALACLGHFGAGFSVVVRRVVSGHIGSLTWE